MTADLVAFLNARLDEDAAAARQAFGPHNDDGPEWTEVSSGVLSTGDELHGIGDSGITRHMARWDPARVLAEVDAKRRIVAEFVPALDASDEADDKAFGPLYEIQVGRMTKVDYEPTALPLLRLLALPYADHPGYRPEWAPST